MGELYKSWQKRVYNLIREDDENDLSGTIFDSIIIVFILLNVVVIVVDTFHFSGGYLVFSRIVELVSVVVFSAEYLLRIWTAPLMYPDRRPSRARLKYIFSFMALIDLVSILPFYLPFFIPIKLGVLRSLRILRLLRVFKISRYTSALDIMGRVFRKKAYLLFSSVLIVFLLMLIGSVIMFEIESGAQPDKFDNAFSAFWWALSTVTTIGYGDLYPITTAGKLLGGVIALLGVGLVAVPTGIISAGFIEESRHAEHQEAERAAHHNEPGKGGTTSREGRKKRYCPYCGEELES